MQKEKNSNAATKGCSQAHILLLTHNINITLRFGITRHITQQRLNQFHIEIPDKESAHLGVNNIYGAVRYEQPLTTDGEASEHCMSRTCKTERIE